MNDDQAAEFMESVIDHTIVNIIQTEGFGEDPTTTLILDDGSELSFHTDSIRQATPDADAIDALVEAVFAKPDAAETDTGAVEALAKALDDHAIVRALPGTDTWRCTCAAVLWPTPEVHRAHVAEKLALVLSGVRKKAVDDRAEGIARAIEAGCTHVGDRACPHVEPLCETCAGAARIAREYRRGFPRPDTQSERGLRLGRR